MDVAVEHGYGAEALQIGQSAGSILGAPAPRRIDGPQGDMGEDHDGGARREPPHIIFKPRELRLTEVAQPAGLQGHDVDEADEVDAVAIDAVLAVPASAWAIARMVGIAVV